MYSDSGYHFVTESQAYITASAYKVLFANKDWKETHSITGMTLSTITLFSA